MPTPSLSVIEAIFDSYLSMRNQKWMLIDVERSVIHMPKDKKTLSKLEAAVRFIDMAKQCQSTSDWVKLAAALHESERFAIQENENKYLVVRFFTDVPLLGLTLRAIRTYIAELIKGDKYETSVGEQVITAEALKDDSGYYRTYFTDYVKKRDPRNLMSEVDFETYLHNIKTGKRVPTKVALLLAEMAKPQVQIAPAAPPASSELPDSVIALAKRKGEMLPADEPAKADEQSSREAERIASDEQFKRQFAEQVKEAERITAEQAIEYERRESAQLARDIRRLATEDADRAIAEQARRDALQAASADDQARRQTRSRRPTVAFYSDPNPEEPAIPPGHVVRRRSQGRN